MKRELERRTWMLVGAGAAMLAGSLTQRLLESGWRTVADDDPPEKPWRGDSWKQALAWACISATVVAAAQLAAKQGAHKGWKKVTGHAPPAA